MLMQMVITHVTNNEIAGMKKDWQFPSKELHGYIQGILATLVDINEQSNDMSDTDGDVRLQAKAAEEVKLLDGVAILLKRLEMCSIPAMSVIPEAAVEAFADVLRGISEETRKSYVEKVAYLNRPTKYQEKAWSEALPDIEKAATVMSKLVVSEEEKQSISGAINRLKEHNKAIEVSNKELSITPQIYTLPVNALNEMQQAWIKDNEKQFNAAVVELRTALEHKELATSLTRRLDARIKNTSVATNTDVPAATSSSSSKSSFQVSSTSGSSQRTVSHTSPSTNEHPGTSAVEASSLFVPELADIETLRKALNDEPDSSMMFDYTNGLTEFGKFEHIRPTRTENHRYSRFFVNAGTEQLPVFKVVKGSDLGPGGADTLADQANGKETIFDLRYRKKQLSGQANYITSVGPAIQMPFSESKPRPGSKPRQPDAYLRLQYKDNDTPNEWLSRTECISLMGKKTAERYLAQFIAQYDRKCKYLEACKAQRLHPDTNQPLNERDRKFTPWLFPEA
ncbi:hypothetical protein EK21DRAFT_119052 [Setomelanomma holmii]|uniref:Uncharacterized protein n=1 Tax=Setomelanomma holmii TaxID=210430 RepID=A0A9P4GXC3_9PLEO|nr:hypothetical protein EK21DRAFT_119052 [Setomelanomma holmii]